MDIRNNAIVIDADTEALDSQITEISNDFAETYYLDNEQQEELEMLVAKAMKLGELYERKKWQAAKAQAVPEGFVVVPKEPTEEMIQAGRDERRDLGTVASTYKAMIEAQEQAND